LVRAAES